MTLDHYLEIEQRAEFRSEFIDGQIFATAGASPRHAQIQANTLTELNVQLSQSDCSARGSDLLIYVAAFNTATYPDIAVTCGPDKISDIRKGALTDATAIVEVLSPSTESYDRITKFRYYRALPSFSEYLMVSQDAIKAEHHVRQADGSWLWREYTGPEAAIEMKSIGCTLALAKLYRRVEFETSHPSPAE